MGFSLRPFVPYCLEDFLDGVSTLLQECVLGIFKLKLRSANELTQH